MCIDIFVERIVAPLAGAWIEIIHPAVKVPEARVAPLAGAWIEIIIVVSLF